MVALLAFATAPAQAAPGQWRVGAYQLTVTALPDNAGEVLTIIRDGKTVEELRDFTLTVSPESLFRPDGSDAAFNVGADFLGAGVPVVPMLGYSGGAHCCFTLTVLLLGEAPRRLPPVDAQDYGESLHFELIPGHAVPILRVHDSVFGYWKSGFAGSAAPLVVIGFDPRRMVFAPDLRFMRTVLPPSDDLAARVARIRASPEWNLGEGDDTLPKELLTTVTDLLYGGHWLEAQAFVDVAWMGTPEQRDAFWKELTTCQIRRSVYWPAVATIGGQPPDSKPEGCPKSE
jgi:hypothetical protein